MSEASESPLKVMKNAFYFAIKRSFHSQDIYIFVLTFLLCKKTT